LEQIVAFVGLRHSVDSIEPLEKCKIADDRAVLLSQSCNGWSQILGNCDGLRYAMSEWFVENPMCKYLSATLGEALHLWTLNSSTVAGYSLFRDGRKCESTTVFAEVPPGRNDVMPGVPAPEDRPGQRLGEILGRTGFSFSNEMRKEKNLEIGIAQIVASLGFDVHLLDFYNATDGFEGIGIEAGRYRGVPLSGWRAILFQ
jgi:hypothetical protein